MKALLLLVFMLEGFYCYEYCSSYRDFLDNYMPSVTCSDYCCGTTTSKYCCSDACYSLTLSSECDAANVNWIPIVAGVGGLVGFILIVSLLVYCCYRCCCATPRQRGAVIMSPQQTRTTVTMNMPATTSTPIPMTPSDQPGGAHVQPPPYPGKY